MKALPRDSIRVSGWRVECIIGVYPEERLSAQPLLIDLLLKLDLTEAATTGALSATVDYARLTTELAKIVAAGRYRLLESAALAILSYCLTPAAGQGVPQIVQADVRLGKPAALGAAALPQVRLVRSQAEIAACRPTPSASWPNAIVLHECPEATLVRFMGRAVLPQALSPLGGRLAESFTSGADTICLYSRPD